MVEILQELFKYSKNKSNIELHDICSDCKSEVIIKITPTLAGFGLQGGALFKNTNGGGYYARCPHCCKTNPVVVN